MAKKQILQQGGDGTAVPTGMVGEEKTVVGTSDQNITNSETYYNALGASSTTKLTLTPGVWLVYGRIAYSTTSMGTGTATTTDAIISTSSSAPDSNSKGLTRLSINDAIGGASQIVETGIRYFAVTSNTDIYLLARIGGTATTTTGSKAIASDTRITGVRIA
jgi:hypothetical protein